MGSTPYHANKNSLLHRNKPAFYRIKNRYKNNQNLQSPLKVFYQEKISHRPSVNFHGLYYPSNMLKKPDVTELHEK